MDQAVMNNKNRGGLSILRFIPIGLAAFLLFSMVSISVSQIFLGLTLIGWIYYLIRERRRFRCPGFFWPLAAYAGLSLLAAFFSVNPEISLWDTRELLMFLIVPLVYTGFSREEDLDRVNMAFLGSAALGLFIFIPFLLRRGPGARFSGFAGHYMTEAGMLLMFCMMAGSMVLFSRLKIRWLWGAVLLISLVMLTFTLTRSAWVGLFSGALVLLLLYKPKTLLLLPLLAAAVYFISPGSIRDRALSIFNPKNPTNMIRFEYIRAGLKIIKDFPVLGTGPDTVDMVFQHPKYGLSQDARRNVHLHNNLIQIAAERGLITLTAWLVFLVWVFISLMKSLRTNKDPSVYSAAALAALTALFVAGLFEYNFADSEIAVIFLYLISLPGAAARLRKEKGRLSS